MCLLSWGMVGTGFYSSKKDTASHFYTSVGSYDVIVTVYDSTGLMDSNKKTVVVKSATPGILYFLLF